MDVGVGEGSQGRKAAGDSRQEGEVSVELRGINSIRFLTQPLDSHYDLSPEVHTQGSVSLRLAEFRATHQKCTVRRIVKTSSVRRSQTIEKLYTEVEVLSKVDHPNILRTFETFEDSQSYYVISEAVIPGEFQRFLDRWAKLPLHVTVTVMEQVLSALNYCHQQGIVHRNIKLDNLVFQEPPGDDTFTLKVAGFSDACLLPLHKLLDTVIGSSTFIAPEVLSRHYTEKCDIWSCGVLFYYLLTGKFPFEGETTADVLRKVRAGEAQFDGERWRGVEEDARDMVRAMLAVNYELRPSASECLSNRWFLCHCPASSNRSKPFLRSMSNLLASQAHAALKQAIMFFIISRVADQREIGALAQSFRALDVNKDGKISSEELKQGFERLMPPDRAETEVERIMDLADLNKNGAIDYTEFLISSFSREKLLSSENLVMAFNSFDGDGSGKISVNELKELFVIRSDQDKEALWKELVSVVDSSGDGEIDLREFVDLMTKALY